MQKNSQISLRSLQDDPALRSYELLEVMGQGCFGTVVRARDRQDGRLVALKIEDCRRSRLKPILRHEAEIMRRLSGLKGVPEMYLCGEWRGGLFLEMELLEHDLNHPQQYSQNEICEITLELLAVMEGMHGRGVVHRDLKPQNLMRKAGKLYLVDYGLAKTGRSGRESAGGFVGTPRYASVQAHEMLQQGKRDDLQSLFYTLAYLYYGKLPWSRLQIANDEKLDKIRILKIKHRSSLFCQMPPAFHRAFNYITSLHQTEEPDYTHLKSLFRRNKTVIIIPPREREDRSKVKRVSLNFSHFLQVPDLVFQQRSQHSDASCEKSGRSGLASEAVVRECFKAEGEEGQNYVQEQERGLPQMGKYFKEVVLKNPFG